MKRKRKRCMNCGNGEVLRAFDAKDFPMGVACDLIDVKKVVSPWDLIEDCGHWCDKWRPRTADDRLRHAAAYGKLTKNGDER